MEIAPARLCRTLAEVVFFAVTLAEVLCVKQSHLLQAVAADVHTKPDTGGHVHHSARIGLRTQCVQPCRVVVRRQGVVLAKTRVAADRGVVGKRRNRAYLLVSVGCAANTVEPIIGDLSIAVE